MGPIIKAIVSRSSMLAMFFGVNVDELNAVKLDFKAMRYAPQMPWYVLASLASDLTSRVGQQAMIHMVHLNVQICGAEIFIQA